MGLESTTNIDGLVETNPVGSSDTKAQGDDHLRLIKTVLKTTFPGYAGAHLRQSFKTSTFTAVKADNGTFFHCTGAWTLNLDPIANLANGWSIVVNNADTGDIVIDCDGSELINGLGTLSVPAGWCCYIYAGASSFKATFAPSDASTIMRNNIGLHKDWLDNVALSVSVATGAITIALKTQTSVGANDPSTTDPVIVGFRVASETSSLHELVRHTAALSLVIPAGASLGVADSAYTRLYVYALRSSVGNMVLAVINRSATAQGVVVVEHARQDSTAIDASSDSANVFYSTAGHTTREVHLLGWFEIQRGTGSWDNAPSKVMIVGERDEQRIGAAYPFYRDFGDGSDGAVTYSASANLAPGVYNHTEFKINSGVTMTVTGSGILIVRCTGTATIDGTIAANAKALPHNFMGGDAFGFAGGSAGGLQSYAASSGAIYRAAAGPGVAGTAATEAMIKTALAMNQPVLGGGYSDNVYGGWGGGFVVIIARRLVFNSGATINCAGGNGSGTVNSGGGGGGVIIFSYQDHLTDSGTKTVTAGTGVTGGGNGAAGWTRVLKVI